MLIFSLAFDLLYYAPPLHPPRGLLRRLRRLRRSDMSALSLRWGGIRALPGMGIRCCMMCHGSGPDSPSINRRLRQYSSDLKPTLSFEEYRGRKKTLKLRTRIAGLPMAVVGSALSGSVSIYLNPRMFEMTPEDVQSHLIL